MRALLLPDPHRGPGYSVIEIHGTPPLGEPRLLLRRASDGAWLSGFGWGESETSLTPDGWESAGDDSGEAAQRLLLGPNITDNLDPDDAYTLTIPGAGSCALMLGALDQSHILGGEPVGVTPPPVPGYRPESPELRDIPPESAVNEGVEPTPEVTGAPADALPTGVVAVPREEAEPSNRKKPGCGLLAALLALGCLGAGLALGYGAGMAAEARHSSTGVSALSPCPGTSPDVGGVPEAGRKPKP